MSKLFRAPGGELIVNDTPGSNAMRDKLEHNMQIAAALNYSAVSRILIVVKADTRIDTTVDHIRKGRFYLIRFGKRREKSRIFVVKYNFVKGTSVPFPALRRIHLEGLPEYFPYTILRIVSLLNRTFLIPLST